MREVAGAVVVVVSFIFISAGAAQGDLLNLSRDHYPRIYTGSILVTYDADGAGDKGLLIAEGWPMAVDSSDVDTVDLWDGIFYLECVIDPATGAAESGSLTVTGDLDGVNTVTLMESTILTAFGSGAEDLFEFKFTQEGTTPLVPDTDTIGVILDGREVLDFSVPDFSSDFTNDGWGNAESFYMPEPTTVVLVGLGAIGILRRRHAM